MVYSLGLEKFAPTGVCGAVDAVGFFAGWGFGGVGVQVQGFP